jgi:hypothetical protein
LLFDNSKQTPSASSSQPPALSGSKCQLIQWPRYRCALTALAFQLRQSVQGAQKYVEEFCAPWQLPAGHAPSALAGKREHSFARPRAQIRLEFPIAARFMPRKIQGFCAGESNFAIARKTKTQAAQEVAHAAQNCPLAKPNEPRAPEAFAHGARRRDAQKSRLNALLAARLSQLETS